MKKIDATITRYEYENEIGKYYLDIVETETMFEAWITKCNYGLSSFLFGVPKEYDNTVTGEHVVNTHEYFLELAMVDIDEDICFYEEEMMDIEEMNCEKI